MRTFNLMRTRNQFRSTLKSMKDDGNDIYRFLYYKFGEKYNKNIVYDDPLCCAYNMEQHKEVLVFPKEYKYNVLTLSHNDIYLCKHLEKVSYKLSNRTSTIYFNPHPHNSLEWMNLHVNCDSNFVIKPHQFELSAVMHTLRVEEMACIP